MNDLLAWGIEDTTNSAGPRRRRQTTHLGFWLGMLCGCALTLVGIAVASSL